METKVERVQKRDIKVVCGETKGTAWEETMIVGKIMTQKASREEIERHEKEMERIKRKNFEGKKDETAIHIRRLEKTNNSESTPIDKQR